MYYLCSLKTKVLISFEVSAKLICVFVFSHMQNVGFSHDASHLNSIVISAIDWLLWVFMVISANLPSQPTSVSAISLGNGFLVKWSPPLENADLVVGYKIQYKQGTETKYITVRLVSYLPHREKA